MAQFGVFLFPTWCETGATLKLWPGRAKVQKHEIIKQLSGATGLSGFGMHRWPRSMPGEGRHGGQKGSPGLLTPGTCLLRMLREGRALLVFYCWSLRLQLCGFGSELTWDLLYCISSPVFHILWTSTRYSCLWGLLSVSKLDTFSLSCDPHTKPKGAPFYPFPRLNGWGCDVRETGRQPCQLDSAILQSCPSLGK